MENCRHKMSANSWLCAIIQKTKWTIILHYCKFLIVANI